ncbi:MAG: hypothetical protein JKY65_02020 [Planctomycetes bacterium]|nr:hypothetical protein [Planctomycetota bacterium]
MEPLIELERRWASSLLESGRVSQAQLTALFEHQQRAGGRLCDLLVTSGVLSAAEGAEILCLAFDSEGGRLVTGARNGLVQLWRWTPERTLELAQALQHSRPVIGVAFRRQGSLSRVVSTDTSGLVRLWTPGGDHKVFEPTVSGHASSRGPEPGG